MRRQTTTSSKENLLLIDFGLANTVAVGAGTTMTFGHAAR